MERIPDQEYKERAERVQAEMERRQLDLLLAYSCECESANVRYLADFKPCFDFAGVLVPRQGEPALVTGGPESIVYAQAFSRIKKIFIHPFFLETSAPEYSETKNIRFSDIIPQVAKGLEIKKVGIAGSNIMPAAIYRDLEKALPGGEIVEADDVLFKVRMIKSDNELKVLERAYKITEAAMKAAIDYTEAGKREWEIEAKAQCVMRLMGAEGTSYPVWVCSGPNTNQGLSKSSIRKIRKGELVQLSIGAKYEGYCGNMCRALVVGNIPKNIRRLMEVALQAEETILDAMEPGVEASSLYKLYVDILKKHGFEKPSLYGPAHGTGTQECEGPWIDSVSTFTLEPGMVFNVDIWLAEGNLGLRIEDGIAITERGGKELSSYMRKVISK